jgi:hypothetical protein
VFRVGVAEFHTPMDHGKRRKLNVPHGIWDMVTV